MRSLNRRARTLLLPTTTGAVSFMSYFVGCAKSRCQVSRRAQPRDAILRTRYAEKRAGAHPSTRYHAVGLSGSLKRNLDQLLDLSSCQRRRYVFELHGVRHDLVEAADAIRVCCFLGQEFVAYPRGDRLADLGDLGEGLETRRIVVDPGRGLAHRLHIAHEDISILRERVRIGHDHTHGLVAQLRDLARPSDDPDL